MQGVGTKVALAVLGTLKPADLASAIAMRDKAMVARTPGVGPKVAERIVTELKDKAPAYTDVDPALVRLSGALDEKRAPQPVADAVSALVNLGYGQPQAAAAIAAAARSAGEGAEATTLDPARLKGAGEVKRPAKLSKADEELIAAATAAIKQRYRDDWQEVGAALRTRSGKSSPASISTPISAAWRSAPRRWRSGAPSSISAMPASTRSSRCAIRRRGKRIRPSRWCRRAAPAAN